MARRPRRAIFDLGCGNGNHLHLYLDCVGPDGRVAALDREAALIDQAKRRYGGVANVDLRIGSMDEPLPFADSSFDTSFSNFGIYNAADPAFALSELKRILQPGGDVVLIGPTINNAREIYAFNERLTGKAIDEVTLIRTDRLRPEIVPLARGIFAEVREEVINSQLDFPSAEEFLRYYMFDHALRGCGRRRARL